MNVMRVVSVGSNAYKANGFDRIGAAGLTAVFILSAQTMLPAQGQRGKPVRPSVTGNERASVLTPTLATTVNSTSIRRPSLGAWERSKPRIKWD